VASVSGAHFDGGPELRQLAQSILDRLDPAVRFAAARATSGREGKCQQVWCPVCALAALVSGEQHPLLGVLAEHGAALLSVLHSMTDAMDVDHGAPGDTPRGSSGGPPEPAAESGSPSEGPAPGSEPGRYQHIPVSVED
jgi:hypothetical protein